MDQHKFFHSMRMKNRRARSRLVKRPIAFLCIIVCICSLLVVMMSVPKLPETFVNDRAPYFRLKKTRHSLGDRGIGTFGNMMLEMLPRDLAFTVFLPSERAFHRDLELNETKSLKSEDFNNTYAILTRILGFSVVPRMILMTSVPSDEEIVYDSISGYSLYITKDLDGRVVINRIRSEQVDHRIGEIVVHIMDGVIMDSDFAQSVQPDEED